MWRKIFGENKSLIYLGIFSIALTFISNFIGILSFFVPVIVSVVMIFIIVGLPPKAFAIYSFLTALGALFSYNDAIRALFFLLAVSAISIPIGIGLKKRYEFKTFMLYSVFCLCLVLVAGLIYDTVSLGLSITLENVINTFFRPTYEMAEALKYSYDAAALGNINIDEIINIYRDMALGIVVSIAIIQVFFTYLFCAFINRYISVVKENMMYPIYNFKVKKIGGILFVIATLITFFSAEDSIYLVSLNFYVIVQFPMALCGLCAINKLMEMYNIKKKTKRFIMILIILFTILPVFNILGSVAFIGGINCILDKSGINTKDNM